MGEKLIMLIAFIVILVAILMFIDNQNSNYITNIEGFKNFIETEHMLIFIVVYKEGEEETCYIKKFKGIFERMVYRYKNDKPVYDLKEKALHAFELQKSQQERSQEEYQYQEESVKLQLEADILASRQSVSEATKAVKQAKYAIPFNSLNIINAQAEEAAAQAGVKALLALKKELFG